MLYYNITMERPRRFYRIGSEKRFADITPLMRHALSFSPPEVAELASQRRANRNYATYPSTASLVADIIEDSFKERDLKSKEGRTFLKAALVDIKSVLDVISRTHPHLDNDALLEVMTHPDTVDTIALLALRSTDDLRNYTENHLENTGFVSSIGSYAIRDSRLQVSHKGCPVAGYVDSYLQTGAVAPLRIFKETVPWATEVHLLSDKWSRSRKTFNPSVAE